jgi:membrane protease YdiL (CAAX protease family)
MDTSKVVQRWRIKPVAAQVLIVLCFLLLTYNRWWLALLGSLLIILLSYVAWPGNNLHRLGLYIPRSHVILALLILPLVSVSAWLLIKYVTLAQGILLIPLWRKPQSMQLVVHTIGETLNEEMILGALLLTSLISRFRRLPWLLASALVAALFTLLHYVFYAWRPEWAINYGILSSVTLLSIFAVGVLRNNCILGAGNIAFAWAIHLGWNLIFMDSSYYSTTTRSMLDEPAVFNAVFGNTLVLAVIMASACLSSLFLISHSPYQRVN